MNIIIIKDCTTAKSKVSTISKTTELKIAHGHLMPRVSICVMDLLSCKLFHLPRGMDRNGLANTESVLAYGHHGWRAWLTCGSVLAYGSMLAPDTLGPGDNGADKAKT